VLEGGGVKGIGLVGALSVLEERGYTFARFAGTSAGSIVGALAATDHTAAQMYQIMLDTDFHSFEDTSLLDRVPLVGKALSVVADQGVYEGQFLREWLAKLLPAEMSTFAGLRLPPDPASTLAADQRYRLVVMASDVSLRRIARFPWDFREAYGLDRDEQGVADAVRASMSIPFFFEPAHLVHGPGRVDERGRPSRSTLVDGGMLSNFPVEVFDRTDGQPPRWPTFGIKLSTRPGQQQIPKELDGPLSLTLAMVGTMTSWYDGMHIDRPDVIGRTIFIDTSGISSTAFGITREEQQRLFDSGRAAAETFLATWDFDAYVQQFGTTAGVPGPAAAPPVAAPGDQIASR